MRRLAAGLMLTVALAGAPQTGGQVDAGLRCPRYTSLLKQFRLPVSYFDYVMYRESRCQWWAYNGARRDRSYGLLQINTKGSLWPEIQRRCKVTSRDQLFTPRTNIACAAALYKAYGRRPWGG